MQFQSTRSNRSKISESEIKRRLNHNFANSKKWLILDPAKLAKLRKRENMRDKELYIPEGFSSDHKKDLQRVFSQSSKGKVPHDALSESDPMACPFAQNTL
jgi:hypothetical protein